MYFTSKIEIIKDTTIQKKQNLRNNTKDKVIMKKKRERKSLKELYFELDPVERARFELDIAEVCMSSPRTVEHWARGYRGTPQLKKNVISKYLDIPVDILFPVKQDVINE